jgi:dihydrofolate reductase
MGRRLYETMLYWETAEEEQELDDAELEWTTLWKALPKVVFSRSLASVEGSNTRLATRSLADEIAALRAEPEPGNIAIGGAELAAEAASLGLIDEYRLRIHPVLVGGGTPYFARNEQQVALELVEARTFASQVQFLHYRVIR